MLGGSLELAKSTYQEDFPSMPLFQYNYTGETPSNLQAVVGTKVKVVEYNTNVQLVLQNTQNLFFESHPFHLHGYNFFVVGMGRGTYDSQKDPLNFNLLDPPALNTVAVPAGGWVALRFLADNPGKLCSLLFPQEASDIFSCGKATPPKLENYKCLI